MSKFRFVMLETDDAQPGTIGAIVDVIRELQTARLPAPAAPASAMSGKLATREAAPVLPARPLEPRLAAPAVKAKTALSAAATGLQRGRAGRVRGVPDLVFAAIKAGTYEPNELALQAYGEVTDTTLDRIRRTVWKLTSQGRLKKNADGSYKAVG